MFERIPFATTRLMADLRFAAVSAVLLAAPVCPAAHAQEIFAGKTLQMIIGLGTGGGYDLWGRALARHIGQHLPGHPNVVPQNMPGAGSYAAANYIYGVAPKDGTAFGIIARDVTLGPLTGAVGARFDATRMSWIGSPTIETNICIASSTARVKSAQDLYGTELILGDTGPGTGTRSYPRALAALTGMKFRLIGGFPSSSDVFLAMERGEVDGICESLDSVKARRPDWISGKKVSVLFQGGTEPDPELAGVPFVLDFARNDADRQAIQFLYAGQGIGRPFVAPPNLPPERLKLLRAAFDATMDDPEFVADIRKQQFDLRPVSGEKLEALIRAIYATPKDVIDRIAGLIN
jgi:tripartite-type tricarboxylate transporter receptor subunit TctC